MLRSVLQAERQATQSSALWLTGHKGALSESVL